VRYCFAASGWITASGYYGSYVKIPFDGKTFYHKIVSPVDNYYAEVDPDTIGQFTGLLDANGAKIFEGDILDNGIDGNKWYVRWSRNGEYCGFVASKNNQDVYAMLVSREYKNAKIVGTIHDKEEA
jgi:uncharacterized phage protein (TIGR01671 family)